MGWVRTGALERGDGAAMVRRLRVAYDRGLAVWGSLTLVDALLTAGEVDVLRLRVVPALAGGGGRGVTPGGLGVRPMTLTACHQHPGGQERCSTSWPAVLPGADGARIRWARGTAGRASLSVRGSHGHPGPPGAGRAGARRGPKVQAARRARAARCRQAGRGCRRGSTHCGGVTMT